MEEENIEKEISDGEISIVTDLAEQDNLGEVNE
jgi:hypothetical protein